MSTTQLDKIGHRLVRMAKSPTYWGSLVVVHIVGIYVGYYVGKQVGQRVSNDVNFLTGALGG
jgi:hypothetical protein